MPNMNRADFPIRAVSINSFEKRRYAGSRFSFPRTFRRRETVDPPMRYPMTGRWKNRTRNRPYRSRV